MCHPRRLEGGSRNADKQIAGTAEGQKIWRCRQKCGGNGMPPVVGIGLTDSPRIGGTPGTPGSAVPGL